MSRRRSAFATGVVVSVFLWFYTFALAIPVNSGDASGLWSARGHAWFGASLARLLDGFSFLWGSVVRNEYSVVPESVWPAVVFLVVLAGLVYASLRAGSGGPFSAAGRVLGASVLAGGITNLFAILSPVLRSPDGLDSLQGIVKVLPEDGIWLGISVGLVGGLAACLTALVAQLASAAIDARGVESSTAPRTPVVSSARARARRVAAWGALPMLTLALVGGLVWDYGPDVYRDAEVGPGAAWVRLAWFAHASLAAPDDPYALGNAFDTSVWLPRALTSAALIVLVWIVVRLLAAHWQRGGEPRFLGIVLQCWGVVAVLAVVMGLAEGALLPGHDPEEAGYYRALGNVADAVRFAVCLGWIIGVAVALAYRLSGRPATETDPADRVNEGSTG